MNQSTAAKATNQVGYFAPLRSLSSFAPLHRRRSAEVSLPPSVLHRRLDLLIIINPSQTSLLLIIIAFRSAASHFPPHHHHRFEASLFHQAISIEVLSSSSSYFHHRSVIIYLHLMQSLFYATRIFILLQSFHITLPYYFHP